MKPGSPEAAPPLARGLGALALGLVVAVALVATWPAPGVGLTEAAEALRADPARVSDGVATWAGWRPLAGAWPELAAHAAHALQAVLWAVLAALALVAGRTLGLALPGATLAAVALAAHPLAGALAGDVAARGPVLGLIGLTGVAAIAGRARSPALPWAAAAAALTALGALGHPVALLAPLVAFAALPGRLGARLSPPVLAATATALVLLATGLALGGAPDAAPAPDLVTGLANAGRAVRVALTGDPILGWPWDLPFPTPMSDYRTLIGAFAIAASAWVVLRVARSGVRAGMTLACAALALLAQPVVPLASPAPPVLIAAALIGLAWAAAAWVPPGRRWLALPAGAAAVALFASVAWTRPVSWFEGEAAAARHALASAPEALPLRLAQVERALDTGRPGVALSLTVGHDDEALAPLRLRALLDLKRWGDAGRLVARATPETAPLLRCVLASERGDVDAERHCREAVAAAPDDGRPHLALARALDRMGRAAEAELVLRQRVAADGGPAARVALIDHFERFGWIREAVAATEAWLAARPGDRGARPRLVALLERKVKGDLLERRWVEAATAARRLLALAPEREAVRFYLADALAGAGDSAGAQAERVRAEASGAVPPPPPEGLPTLPGAGAPGTHEAPPGLPRESGEPRPR